MEEEINQLLFDITNAHWNRIVRHLLNKYQKQFLNFPQQNGIIMLLRVD